MLPNLLLESPTTKTFWWHTLTQMLGVVRDPSFVILRLGMMHFCSWLCPTGQRRMLQYKHDGSLQGLWDSRWQQLVSGRRLGFMAVVRALRTAAG